MSYSNKQVPTVQAGSMADIAFLLLIFFLISTKVPNDKGLARKLPSECLNPPCTSHVNERNIFRINLNSNDEIFANDAVIPLNELQDLVKEFVNNNGDASCDYCIGKGLATSSDNPERAVVSLITHRETSYKHFINVQDEITEAYLELRTDYSKNKFNKSVKNLSSDEIAEVKQAYPFILSEADIK